MRKISNRTGGYGYHRTPYLVSYGNHTVFRKYVIHEWPIGMFNARVLHGRRCECFSDWRNTCCIFSELLLEMAANESVRVRRVPERNKEDVGSFLIALTSSYESMSRKELFSVPRKPKRFPHPHYPLLSGHVLFYPSCA